jgi:hypothetical protein
MRRIFPVMMLCAMGAGAAHGASAAEPEFQIAGRVGRGDLQIDKFDTSDDFHASTNIVGVGGAFGYLTPVGVVLEAGADSFGQFDFFGFDRFSLTQQYLGVGYQFELGNGWRLVPKAGRARWTLRSKEGVLFNPGPEVEQKIRGYDYYWEVSVSRRISRVVALGVSYKQGDYDFGRPYVASFLVTLGF